MGGSRKHHNQRGQQRNGTSSGGFSMNSGLKAFQSGENVAFASGNSNNTNNDGLQRDGNDLIDNSGNLDFHRVLQEVEGSFQVTWKEIILVIVGIFLLALLSICVGIAAGMTISIHYYENQSPSVRRMDVSRDYYEPTSPNAATAATGLYSGNAAYQRVTTLDPMIVSSNVMKKRDSEGLDLGKVITTTPSGQLNVLMVVEETDFLQESYESSKDGTDSSGNIYSSNSPMNGSSPASHGTSFTSTSDSIHSNFKHNAGSKWHRHGTDHEHWKDSLNGDKEFNYSDRYPSSVPRTNVQIRDSTIRPTLCSDGITTGFDTWYTLRAAVQEANALSAERFMKWNEFFASQSIGSGKPYTFASFHDSFLYYEEDVIFTICPNAVLKARRGPIFINAENVVIECEDCTINVGGTHLAFGPHAKNVLVRGVTFKGARTSSLTFFHDGADASFEDCCWIGNSGINGKFGAVADVNSTSTVNFYRCEISQGKKAYGGAPGFASSLSIRA